MGRKRRREEEEEGWEKTEEGMIFIAGCGPLTARGQKKFLSRRKKKKKIVGSALDPIWTSGNGQRPLIGPEAPGCQ